MKVLNKTATLAVGWTLIPLGILGLVLPILQGTLFLVLGLYLISRHSNWAHRLLMRFRNSHLRAASLVDRLEGALERLFGVKPHLRPATEPVAANKEKTSGLSELKPNQVQ